MRAFQRTLQAEPTAPPKLLALHLHDRSLHSGIATGHYFHQDLLVARRILASAPAIHFDVGSRIDGFVAHVAVFREITVVDVRPNTIRVANIHFVSADLSATLPAALHACCDSLSCLHALEHFGLGRYGDPIDPSAHHRGLYNLQCMLKPGGILHLSVPIGPARIEFNAQRVFAVRELLTWVGALFEVISVAYVDDAGDLHESAPLDEASVAVNFGCQYGCAILELRKPVQTIAHTPTPAPS